MVALKTKLADLCCIVSTEISSTQVVHNVAQNRFELPLPEGTAIATYRPEGARMVFDHTYVPPTLRGRGVAAVLVRAALDEARRQRWQIVPGCSYVAEFVKRHPEYADLVDSLR